jgi:MSHA biogenesis protein MshP
MMQKLFACTKQSGRRRLPRPLVGQRGFSLFSAIFLLVMLSALGAAIVNVTSSSQIASALDIQGERAYQAARAGIEWGLYQQLRDTNCADAKSFTLPAGTMLTGFTVTVNCYVERKPKTDDSIENGQLARASPLNLDGLTLKPIAGALMLGIATVSDVDDTSILADGMIVRGIGIPVGTKISSVDGPTMLTLTNKATVGGVQNITYQSDLDTYTLKSTACNQPAVTGATVSCPHAATSNHPDYVQRVLEVRF